MSRLGNDPIEVVIADVQYDDTANELILTTVTQAPDVRLSKMHAKWGICNSSGLLAIINNSNVKIVKKFFASNQKVGEAVVADC